jgi:dTDP-4-amino-4,6-dideoxygalactose transaminase
VLRVKLRHLERWNERRSEIARLYTRLLSSLPLELPDVPDWAEPSWHLFVIQADERDALREGLAERGVETLIHYPCPPHLQGAYADAGFAKGEFPIAERLADRVLSLPIGPHLSLLHAAEVSDELAAATKGL